MSDGFRSQHEQFHLDLTSRQVSGVLVGGLLALATAFSLGVSVGHRVATTPASLDTPRTPQSLDAPVPPPTPPVAFHEALRANDDVVKPAPVTAAVAKLPEPEPAPVVAPPVVAEPVVEAPKPVEKAIEKPLEKVVARPEPVKPEAAKPEPVKPEAVPDDDDIDSTWTVQFASSPTRHEADKLASNLSDHGYTARVVVADLPGKGRYYRVRVGRFASRETADLLRREASSKTGVSGVVMRSQ